MENRNYKEQTEHAWGQTARALILSFGVVTGAVISFVVVMKCIGRVDAVVSFVRNNLAISLAGGCAFYVVIFILMNWVIQGFLNSKGS